MRKVLIALVVVMLASLSLTATAQAQDDEVVTGTVVADPATVPEAGEYTFTATGTDFIPDTSILVLKCVLPGDPVTSVEEALAASADLDALADCDIAAAQNVDVDSSGGWTATLTAEVGDNFLVSAGDLAGTQAGGTWVPIVPAAAEEPGTIVDVAVAAGSFETLVAAVTAADLVDTLSGEGPFTVFAPTDEAFAAALDALGLTAEEVLASEDLASILTYHVVAGEVDAATAISLDGQSADTVNGAPINISVVDGNVVINDTATVITPDVQASNGIIHVIDAVLLPPSDDADADEEAEESEEAEETEAAEEEEAADEDLAETGVETGLLAVVGAAVLGAGVLVTREGRRFRS